MADDEVMPTVAPAIRITAMPADANPYGDIFGGWLMGPMDMAACVVASRHSKGRPVTVAVEGMKFHHPVFVGHAVPVVAPSMAVCTPPMTTAISHWHAASNLATTH